MQFLDITLVVLILAATLSIFSWRFYRNSRKKSPFCSGCKCKERP